MCKAIRASLLILLLACSAQAGLMPNGSPEPASQPASAPEEGYTASESFAPSQSAAAYEGTNEAASLTLVALELFAVLPSLL